MKNDYIYLGHLNNTQIQNLSSVKLQLDSLTTGESVVAVLGPVENTLGGTGLEGLG